MSLGIPCPECGNRKTDVTDSRPVDSPFASTKRRRACACGHRFSTVELHIDCRLDALLDSGDLPDHLRAPFLRLWEAAVAGPR